MSIVDFNYFPLLRTRDAELKAYSNLSSHVKDGILPIFEITRSRRSKNNPDGNINKRVEQLLDIHGARPFIIDLTTHEMWNNLQIDNLLNNFQNGFSAWCDFLSSIKNDSIVPMIHYHNRASTEDIKQQISKLENNFNNIAYRDNVNDIDLMERLIQIVDYCNKPENLVVILDTGMLDIQNTFTPVNTFQQRIEEINQKIRAGLIIILAGFFPQSVVAPGYGQDDHGQFEILPIRVFNRLNISESTIPIRYSDYGSVCPNPYSSGFGGWVPRVDVPMNDTLFYYRFRRDVGGYIRAASEVLSDAIYEINTNEDVWGDNEISQAAEGNPNGRSPAHWISVRVNLHISRQYYRWNKLKAFKNRISDS